MLTLIMQCDKDTELLSSCGSCCDISIVLILFHVADTLSDTLHVSLDLVVSHVSLC